jgi:hypothetical protein
VATQAKADMESDACKTRHTLELIFSYYPLKTYRWVGHVRLGFSLCNAVEAFRGANDFLANFLVPENRAAESLADALA